MEEIPRKEICQRIAQVRTEVAGPRGKSAFAKKLGLSPSTYDYYENARVPPAEVLLRIAEVGGVDLHWLLTGHSGSGELNTTQPALQRAAKLLADCPDGAAPLAAFVEILAESMKFPRAPKAGKAPAARQAQPTGQPADENTLAAPVDAEPLPYQPDPHQAWIPILGRTAAGVPHFWADPAHARGLTTLADLVSRYARRRGRTVSATISAGEDQTAAEPVQVITLTAPDADDVVEFISCPRIKARHDDAFAVRVDGESMSPDIAHGDLVILSPSVPAADGRAAVVQLSGQIGVTCKLFRRSGETVHLVPISEQISPLEMPGDQVVWALRVLATVRV